MGSMGKNEGVYRIWGSLEEDEWWRNWEIFSSLGSWDKYWGNMEGVRKCGRRCGEMCWGVGEERRGEGNVEGGVGKNG